MEIQMAVETVAVGTYREELVFSGGGIKTTQLAKIYEKGSEQVHAPRGIEDRERGVEGKRGELGGGRIIKKKKKKKEREGGLSEVNRYGRLRRRKREEQGVGDSGGSAARLRAMAQESTEIDWRRRRWPQRR